MKSLKEKISGIVDGDFEVHHIFKEIVQNRSIFTEDEEIVDLLFIKREHLNERVKTSPIFSPASLLVATTHGLVYAVEGFEEINDKYLGYKMKHIYYDQISALELDLCLLKGNFKVTTSSSIDILPAS
ncbi:hypothetical protein C8C76_13916 [Halanaerobium saccharolyticum]|jgi:hypothetical protein|uniref:Uncharacterized protein n=1 Tax=Halanaerobium saccharolyticum TaxID=43595 RepID=A0A2T5RG92_9FIRM|nr:hypothetical protein [Halanaerobium saccharolyticum]PTV93543.1 hypothetical protein C8C76_13916 [Halanaerobium saccharolyticum]PUU93781.1 MAG: hypothetical protein CI947_806 [Halanaerobium sp.]TDP89086.1 hypothetical protein C7957_1266 [Halanaerobium saccharolyticum]